VKQRATAERYSSQVEEDGEEVFMPMDVCYTCISAFYGSVAAHPALQREEQNGLVCMVCPQCRKSYGEFKP
jgi:hypothetical protein